MRVSPALKALTRLSSSVLSDVGTSSSSITGVAASGATGISVPQYDRTLLTPGILHIGQGNFHRAHMASYLDDLFHLEDTTSNNDNNQWGILGAGVMSFDQDKRDILEPQDWLQTLVMRDATSTTAKIVGSMVDFLPVNANAIQTALDADSSTIKIVSLTVTEGGYFLNDGKFDTSHPQIQHDIQNPEDPQTVFGIIVRALKKYKDTGNTSPFTVMSCDNVPHNGDAAKTTVVSLARETDPSLADWIESNVGFPNSMVDRITPATTDEQREFVRSEYGFIDAAPVFCEPFRQWVLEDTFSAGRPNLDLLDNVKFVEDVTPYEFMKIRILNGGHACLCYPSALLGLQYVHDAMEHPTIAPFLDALERQEIIPTVPPVPDTDLADYWKIIAQRFSNPTINDTIDRNCYDGASRQPKFIVPVIQDNLEAGRKVDGLALVSAMWCRYCQGKTEAGDDIPANDPRWDAELKPLAQMASAEPLRWLDGLPDVFGKTAEDPVYQESFCKAMKTIESEGVEAAMKQYTASVNN